MSIARVYRSKFAARKGATLQCEKCRQPIAKGEEYRWFKVGFRSRFKHVRCLRAICDPKPSELESSALSEVYSAQEDATSSLDSLAAADPEDDWSSVRDIMETVREAVENVAQQYHDQNDAFGGNNAEAEERADTLDSAASDLDWSPDEEQPDYDGCPNPQHDPDSGEAKEDGHLEFGDPECGDCVEIRREWWESLIDSAREVVDGIETP